MITIKDISKAQIAISKHTSITPMIYSNSFSKQFNRKVFCKCELFQRTGSFKIRGNINRFLQFTPEEKINGIVTPSYANHAQAAASAARLINCPLTVVMPLHSSTLKTDYVKRHDAKLVLHGETFDDVLQHARSICAEEESALLHPYEDPALIAGAGTIGLEILDQNPDTEAVIVPVGGGALIAGLATAIKEKKPKVAIIGVQTQNCPSFFKAYHSKSTDSESETSSTIADAINIPKVSQQNYEIAQKYVDDFFVVSEESLISSMISILEQGHLVVEGAGAACLAVLLEDKLQSKYRNVTILYSGGNVDSSLLAKVIQYGLSKRRRVIRLDILTHDEPGKLKEIMSLLTSKSVNIIQVYQNQLISEAEFNQTRVQVLIETRGAENEIEDIVELLKEHGFEVGKV